MTFFELVADIIVSAGGAFTRPSGQASGEMKNRKEWEKNTKWFRDIDFEIGYQQGDFPGSIPYNSDGSPKSSGDYGIFGGGGGGGSPDVVTTTQYDTYGVPFLAGTTSSDGGMLGMLPMLLMMMMMMGQFNPLSGKGPDDEEIYEVVEN